MRPPDGRRRPKSARFSQISSFDIRRLETSSGLNSDVGHHGDINPRQSTVDVAFNKQDATIQASVALCERACLRT
jgi:hypothetical protein